MDDKEIEATRLLNLCINSNAPLPEEALSWVKILLNLTDKLQKENEFLKAPFEYANGDLLHKRYVEMNFISKDEIRELREIDNIDYLQFRLKELLGEE